MKPREFLELRSLILEVFKMCEYQGNIICEQSPNQQCEEIKFLIGSNPARVLRSDGQLTGDRGVCTNIVAAPCRPEIKPNFGLLRLFA